MFPKFQDSNPWSYIYPYLSRQHAIDVAYVSIIEQIGGHDPTYHLRNRWDIAIANGDL